MISLIFTAFIVGITVAFYFIFLKPWRRIKRYTTDFQSKGYKVYQFPYNPFDFSVIRLVLKESAEGDGFKSFKNQFSKFDILIGNALTTPIISLLSPQSRKQFAKHQIDYAYKKLPAMVDLIARVLGKGLVFSEGQEWKRKRRILSKFFTYQFISKQIPEIVKICNMCFSEIEEKSKIKSEEQGQYFSFKLIDLTTRMFSNVILSIFLGTQSLEETIEGQKICNFIVRLATDNSLRSNELVPFLLGKNFLNLGLTKLDRSINHRNAIFNTWTSAYIDRIIENAKKNESKAENLLELLYKSSIQKDGQSYNKNQLIDELKIFSFAGTDTTSHFTEMMIYYTARDERIYKKAQQQVDQFKDDISSTENLKKLKYIEAIQKQTIRYYGPLAGSIPRVATKDHYFDGIAIAKGVGVMPQSISTHYNSQIYNKPFEFRPERWFEQNKQYDAACLSGFGIGPRSCIGQSLAMVESKIAFFCFLKRYQEITVPKKVDLKVRFMYEADNLIIRGKRKN